VLGLTPGDKMAFRVTRHSWCGRSLLVGCPVLGSNRVAGAGRRSSAVGDDGFRGDGKIYAAD
jgi:hypothetical protein